MHMTFEELSECVYEDLNGSIVKVGTDDETYRIMFECDDWLDSARRRRFELVFEDVIEATATPSSCGSFYATDQHPLLWQHNDQNVSLFFSSAPPEPHALLGRLYEAHAGMLKGWRELSDYWHADTRILKAGHGRLADGPRQVIDEYARIIADTLRYSIIPGYTPQAGYHVVLFDECYVICRGVSVIELQVSA